MPVGAEEQGLLGSRFYCQNPTFHPGRIAANVNIDGGNIFGRTKDVAVSGKGKSSLEVLLEGAARLQDPAYLAKQGLRIDNVLEHLQTTNRLKRAVREGK